MTTWQVTTSNPTPVTGTYFTNGTAPTSPNISVYKGGSGGTTYITISGCGGTSPTVPIATGPIAFGGGQGFHDTISNYILNNITAGNELSFALPDGAKFIVEKNGSYRIEDKDAKVTYKANRIRNFNTYLNASDRLEDFIRYCQGFDVSQSELLELPLKLFIMWLIIEAASADEVVPELTDVRALNLGIKKTLHPRCRCGRFVSREKATQGFLFCNGAHYDKYSGRTQHA